MPTVFIMVGIPGAGKTTWALSHPELAYVGSDAIRRELYGREMTPRGYRRVHRIMAVRMREHLAAGRDVVVDSAHITPRARRFLLKQLPPGYRAVAVFINTPLKQALHNNQNLDRHVPEPGIRFLHRRLAPPTLQEGFHDIIHVSGRS